MINTKRLTATFLEMVSLDSESFHEREMADYLKKKLEKIGLVDVEEDRSAIELQKDTGEDAVNMAGNLFARLPAKGAADRPAILLSAHMDTVRPGNGKKAVIHTDGTITSEGDTVLGADDAVGIAEILEALQVIVENNLPHPEIEILFPAAEEPYCQGSSRFAFSKVHAKKAYTLDLSGEIGTAAVAAPSIWSFGIRVKGKSAHAGFAPEAGVHAILIAARAIANLPSGRVDAQTTVNIGTVSGGIAKNIVPSEVELAGEIRSMSAENAKIWYERICAEFRSQAELLGGSVEVSKNVHFEAYRIGPQEDVVKSFVRAAKELHLPVELLDTFGGSDNNNFTANGIRGIVLACGMHKVHTTGEYTRIKDLEDATRLLLKLIELS